MIQSAEFKLLATETATGTETELIETGLAPFSLNNDDGLDKKTELQLSMEHMKKYYTPNSTKKLPGMYSSLVSGTNTWKIEVSEMTSLLIENGANINTSSLLVAVPARYSDIVEFLILNKIDINVKDNNGDTFLTYAINKYHEKKSSEILCFINSLISHGFDINTVDIHGVSPLELAVNNGDLDIIKILVENKDDSDGITSLAYAINKGNLDVVKFLVENKDDINTKDSYGITSLIYAINKGNLDVVKFLVENKDDLITKDSDGVTPLVCAINKGNLDIVKFLVENGADINTENDTCIPLIYAVIREKPDIVEFLLLKGADIKIKDFYKKNAYDYANIEIKEILYRSLEKRLL